MFVLKTTQKKVKRWSVHGIVLGINKMPFGKGQSSLWVVSAQWRMPVFPVSLLLYEQTDPDWVTWSLKLWSLFFCGLLEELMMCSLHNLGWPVFPVFYIFGLHMIQSQTLTMQTGSWWFSAVSLDDTWYTWMLRIVSKQQTQLCCQFHDGAYGNVDL